MCKDSSNIKHKPLSDFHISVSVVTIFPFCDFIHVTALIQTLASRSFKTIIEFLILKYRVQLLH